MAVLRPTPTGANRSRPWGPLLPPPKGHPLRHNSGNTSAVEMMRARREKFPRGDSVVYRVRPLHGRESGASRGARHGSYRSGFAFGALSFLVTAVFGVVSTIATARLYGVRIIGQFALICAPVAMLWYLSTVREQAALIKEVTSLSPRHPRVTQLFAAIFTFSFGLTVAMSALTALVSVVVFRGPLHHPELVVPMLVYMAGYALVTNTGWNIDSIFAAFVAGRQLFRVRLNETLSFLAIAIAIGLAWHSVWGLVFATIGGAFVALVHRLIALRHYVALRLSLREYHAGLGALPGLLRFGLKITPGSIAQGVSQGAGIWVLAAIGDPLATLGAYNRAQTVPERLQQLNIRVGEVLYPTLVGRRAKGDGDGFDRALVDSIRYSMLGMLLMAAVLGGAAHAVLALFGPGFGRAAPALALLIVYPALASVTIAQNQAFFAVNRPGFTSAIALARLVVTVALTVALTPSLGIVGPALAVLAGYALQIAWGAIALLPFLNRRLHITWPLRERLALAFAFACGFGAANAVEHALPSLVGLLPSLVAGTAAYLIALLASGAVNARDRNRLGELVGMARSRRARREVTPVAETEPAST